MAPVAYIRHIPPSRASGRLAQAYKEIRADVPRVPNIYQLFSQRPELMVAMHRGWLATMCSGTTPRSLKELIALVISKVGKCEYCLDSHMIFLQAAGTDRSKAYRVEADLGAAEGLTDQERVTLGFAARITADPRTIGVEEVAELAGAWPDTEQRAQAIAVIAGHNMVFRVANALGVALEIPAPLRRFEAGRRGAITLLSRLTALSTDLGERPLAARTPEENSHAFEDLFTRQIGFSEVPPGYAVLESCPEIFDAQLRVIEKSIAIVPRERWMRIGLVVSRLSGCDYFAGRCATWLGERGTDITDVIAASEGARSSLPEAEEWCLRFTRDLTLHSHTIGAERIDELRDKGLSDGAILDLAYVGAVFNGLVRYVRILAAVEAIEETVDDRAPLEEKASA